MVRPASGSASQYISHVIIIIQENRSFENFFAGYPGANAPMTGCALPVEAAKRGASRVPFGGEPVRVRGCPPGDVSFRSTK